MVNTLSGEWLVFKVINETFVVSTRHIIELTRRGSIQAHHLTPEGYEGLTVHRGKALCVINGVDALGMSLTSDDSPPDFLIVFDFGERAYALLVTALIDVIKADTAIVSSYEWTSSPAVLGVANHERLGLITLLDPYKLQES